jgi:hypothetical protein
MIEEEIAAQASASNAAQAEISDLEAARAIAFLLSKPLYEKGTE